MDGSSRSLITSPCYHDLCVHQPKLTPSFCPFILAKLLFAPPLLLFRCAQLRGGETPAPSPSSSPTRPAASHRAESAKPSLLRHSSSVSSTSSRTAQPWDDDNGSGSGVQLGASEGTPFNAPSSQAPDAGEGGEGKKCGKQSTVYQEGAPDTAATAAKAEAGEALVARSRRVVGTSPEEIDLPPGWDAVYFCYNCGSKEHGAMHCPRPPRGTPENTYVPPFPGARRRVSSEWVCARPHGHKSSKAAGPNDHIVAKLEQLHDTYADYGTSVMSEINGAKGEGRKQGRVRGRKESATGIGTGKAMAGGPSIFPLLCLKSVLTPPPPSPPSPLSYLSCPKSSTT